VFSVSEQRNLNIVTLAAMSHQSMPHQHLLAQYLVCRIQLADRNFVHCLLTHEPLSIQLMLAVCHMVPDAVRVCCMRISHVDICCTTSGMCLHKLAAFALSQLLGRKFCRLTALSWLGSCLIKARCHTSADFFQGLPHGWHCNMSTADTACRKGK